MKGGLGIAKLRRTLMRTTSGEGRTREAANHVQTWTPFGIAPMFWFASNNRCGLPRPSRDQNLKSQAQSSPAIARRLIVARAARLEAVAALRVPSAATHSRLLQLSADSARVVCRYVICPRR